MKELFPDDPGQIDVLVTFGQVELFLVKIAKSNTQNAVKLIRIYYKNK